MAVRCWTLLFLFVLLVNGCSFIKRRAIPSNNDSARAPLTPSQNQQNRQLVAMEESYQRADYRSSLELSEVWLRQYASSPYQGEVFFLRGKAFLALDLLSEAEEAFRASYQIWSNSSLGRAKSLYFLAMVFERQSLDQKMIASLLDLRKMAPVLNPRVYELDLPARLAAAYAREGNLVEAARYREQLDLYLKRNLPEKSKWAPEDLELLGAALFSLAENALKDNPSRSFEQQLKAIASAQFYLLRNLELGIDPFAAKALYRFEIVYRGILQQALGDWQSLYHRRDVLQARREQQLRLARLEQIHSLLKELEKSMLPESFLKNPYYQEFLQTKNSLQKEMEIYFLEPEVGQGLTEAAQKLLGLPQPLRPRDPSRLQKKYPKALDLPLPDPNL